VHRPSKHPHTIKALLVALLATVGLKATDSEDCLRGKPYPVFSKAQGGIRSRHFSLRRDGEAEEVINFKSGHLIKIRHWGCEYYVITIRIESKKILREGTSKKCAFIDAIASLRLLHKFKADSVFDFPLAIKTLEKALQNDAALEFEQEFPVEGDGIDFLQTRVKIDAAGRDSDHGFIEITFLKGPLG